MTRTTETPKINHRATGSNPTANPANTSPQAHTDFIEVKVHTAKCDSCEKNNKLTLYRCMECGQHTCSLCWKKSGDKNHVFGDRCRIAPELPSNSNVIEIGDRDGEKGHVNTGTTRPRRRVHVISDDDDDDDNFPVLRPSSRTENAATVDASNQQSKITNAMMSDDQRQDHEDESPDLWPIVPRRGLPVSRPVPPTDKVSATESAKPVMQRDSHMPVKANDPERQRTTQLRRLRPYVSVSDQETDLPALRPSQTSISNQQATRHARLLNHDVIYCPRPGSNLDKQATNPRNQHAFPNPHSLNLEPPHFSQPSVAFQQAPRLIRPAIYNTRPGPDVDLPVARNQSAFAPHQNNSIHQAPQPGQVSIPHHRALYPFPHATQPSLSISQRQVQTAASTDQFAARDPLKTLYSKGLYQHAGASANARAMDARNPQSWDSQQTAQPAANRGQPAIRNQQVFMTNQRSSSAANYEQMIAARDRQQAYLSRQREYHPASGSRQTSISHQRAADWSSRAFLSQMHAASLASRLVQEYPPEVIEAADALLSYAGAEQSPTHRFRFEQNANRDSQLLSPAAQSKSPGSTRSASGSSSMTLVSPSGAAGAYPIASPHVPASTPSPRDTDADSANVRLAKHQRRLAGLQSPVFAREIASDAPASQRSHLHYHSAVLQPKSRPTEADSSAAISNGSSFRPDQSNPYPRSPISEHAAAYLNQWDAGRAALASNVSNTTVNVPAPQVESRRSADPLVGVQNTTTGGMETGEVAETSAPAPNNPVSEFGEQNDGDVVMNSPEIEILGDDKSNSDAVRPTESKSWSVKKDEHPERHARSEEKDEGETNEEHKESNDTDIDVVDATKGVIKEEHQHSRETHDNDDDDDIEITSWNKLDGKKIAERPNRGVKTEGKERKLDKVIKRGVAYVKKPEVKVRKVKTALPKYVG